jgi:streptomycin 6-kinase
MTSITLTEQEWSAWREAVPTIVERLRDRWALTIGRPFDHDGCTAWVAPVTRRDGTPAVLKVAIPHYEAMHEPDALRLWDGDGAVRLLDADGELNALLLERCEPGTSLRELPEAEQDVVLARLLRRLWRRVSEPHPFRTLGEMTAAWSAEAAARPVPDAGLLREAMTLFADLSRGADAEVLLATDLHAGNILRTEREPWLAIDPKPFVGDPAYDATQHLLNCRRLRTSPLRTVHRVADLLELDRDRVRLWTFARCAAEPYADWGDLLPVARALAS